MYTKSLEILTQIKADMVSIIATLPANITINLDEPITLVYDDLPSLSAYQIREDLLPEDSYSQYKKRLLVRIELRMVGSPASTLCTPVVNLICAKLKADRTLGGLADYVELQSIQWANDIVASNYVCGASIDIQIDYLS